jgi:hypothetical protein
VTYFDFPGGWGLYDLNGIAEKELAATGAHGYATAAEARAHPNASPTALQQFYLQLFKADSESPVGAGATGVQSTPASGTGLSGLLGDVTSGKLWVRVGEFAVGALLLYIGLKASVTPGGAQVANQTARQTAQRTLQKVGKAVGAVE